MIKELIKLADHLDKKGLRKEANYLDELLKIAHEDMGEYFQGDHYIDAEGEKVFEVPETGPFPEERGLEAARQSEADIEDAWLQFTGLSSSVQRAVLDRVRELGLDDI